MLEMGIGAVYGQEEEGMTDAVIDCRKSIQDCRAACCTLTFALTRDEVLKGNIKHNPEKPFFISRTLMDIAHTLTAALWNAKSGMTDP